MKQTKFILPAVVLSAAGSAMAAGDLWNMDVDAYQVQIPKHSRVLGKMKTVRQRV